MYVRTYSWMDTTEATQCFGDEEIESESLLSLSTFNCFGPRDSVTLLKRFETASTLRYLRKVWLTDTFRVVLGLARRAQVTPLYYWEQPNPISMASGHVSMGSGRDEGYEVVENCWQGRFTVVHLWTTCLNTIMGSFGLTGHLQVGVTGPYNFEMLRNILRTRGGNDLLRKFAGYDLISPADGRLIQEILAQSTS